MRTLHLLGPSPPLRTTLNRLTRGFSAYQLEESPLQTGEKGKEREGAQQLTACHSRAEDKMKSTEQPTQLK